MTSRYDAILIVAFGGPESPDDVIPFLENVLRGRRVPRERLLEVAEHYQHFGGKSPINEQVRALIGALRAEFDRRQFALPIYWGNRNWHPMLPKTVQQMTDDGVKSALAIVLSSFSSYSGCRQYRENVADARAAVGSAAPPIDKVRVWYNHPDFIAANADRLRAAIESLPDGERASAPIVFTAHSVPQSMADRSDYERQLTESCRLVAETLGLPAGRWQLVYQSRSGRPDDPWLGPDVNEHLAALKQSGANSVVVLPIGFLSDHMEVLYDLDVEAQATARSLGLNMVRGATVGLHPQFVSMLAELVLERLTGTAERRAIGRFGPNHDLCPADCCSRSAASEPSPL